MTNQPNGPQASPEASAGTCGRYEGGSNRKRQMRAFIAVLSASFLSGCIVPIPIGAIDRAVSGSHCVSPAAKVGDTITDARTGDRLTITEINKTEDGTPYRGCGARLPHRAKVKPAAGTTQ